MSTINRLIIALLVVALLFAGCGRVAPSDSDDVIDRDEKQTIREKDKDEPKQSDNKGSKKEEPKASKGGIYNEPGMELSDFYDAFDSAMSRFEGAINSYESDDFELITGIGFDYLVPTAAIVNLPPYDYLEPGDNAKETGKNGKFDAVREKNGDIITFSQTYTNEEDGFGPNDKKGDVKTYQGKLDTKNNTLEYEYIIERNGEVVSRSITEIVRLSDGSYLAQVFEIPQKPYDDRMKHEGHAYLLSCDDEKFEMIVARFEPDYNLKYKSIIGDAGASLESMADGYERLREYTVTEDMVNAIKY